MTMKARPDRQPGAFMRLSRALLLIAVLVQPVAAQDAAKSRVPKWDARGVGPLPRQGIACLDVRDDGAVLVGTIAPSGDPNVHLLDNKGKLVASYTVGQRWIDSVAFGPNGEAFAVCTMPEGKAGDRPELYTLKDGVATPAKIKQEAEWFFHYGDHSNHPTLLLSRADKHTAVLAGQNVIVHSPGQSSTIRLPIDKDGASLSLAVDPAGYAVVGAVSQEPGMAANLFLVAPGQKKPLWSRPPLKDVDAAPTPEKGLYGSPTLPDGTREPLPQGDEKVWAPLSVAIHVGLDGKRLIAAADYQGWRRWVRSSATGQKQDVGIRFMPSRPTITIYRENGEVVHQFKPSTFRDRPWWDLRFSTDGKQLYAWRHLWRPRGLSGRGFLPIDGDYFPENACELWKLDVASGVDGHCYYPTAITDLTVGPTGKVIVARWDGELTWHNDHRAEQPLRPKTDGSCFARFAADGQIVAATSAGTVEALDKNESLLWRVDLNAIAPKPLKPWVTNARATPIVKGLWQIPGGRVESDLGGQRLIEAPDGYILIEGHSGLSFEREWESMKAVGLDPMKVKYVLATHEHGDHAPGAYLWRVVTGAKFVCSEEMAYTLQHHIPGNSGYGLHPPVPTDIKVKDDTWLDLAGLKMHAVRIPGHTAGSMAWHFEMDGKSFVAFGDLIMPRGVLGYSGSINFSARDVLSSLRKLQDLKPDLVLPGHGAIEGPANYFGAGIDVGSAVGWGFIRPEKPDPRFRLSQANVDVVGWGQGAVSAAFGDVDGDGRPDVVMVAPKGKGSDVKFFLNHAGKFNDRPDLEIEVPYVEKPHKVRVIKGPRGSAVFVAGKGAGVLEFSKAWPEYGGTVLKVDDGNHLRLHEDKWLVARRFGGFQRVVPDRGGLQIQAFQPEVSGPYVDFRMVPLKDMGREALVSSYGQVYVRDAKGKLPTTPTFELVDKTKDWHFLAAGDFNGDGRVDLAFLSYGMNQGTEARIFYQRAGDRPFSEKPDVVMPLGPKKDKSTPSLVRDNPAVADWNGDGIDDLIVAHGQSDEVLVFFGGKEGLSPMRMQRIHLDYRVQYEHGPYVADFDGDGKADLAVFGYTNTGVGAGGPPAVYIYRQTK
jgi:metallo-beta-lactamase class B